MKAAVSQEHEDETEHQVEFDYRLTRFPYPPQRVAFGWFDALGIGVVIILLLLILVALVLGFWEEGRILVRWLS
jgi:hypothetical protein